MCISLSLIISSHYPLAHFSRISNSLFPELCYLICGYFSRTMNLSAYPSICPPESRFLASKEGLAQVCRTIGVVSLPIHVLTGYCILFKAPKEMSNVKNSLINLWFWCTTSQITLSFFFTPFNFYPHSASISAGFGTDLHVPTSVQFYIVFAINSGKYWL